MKKKKKKNLEIEESTDELNRIKESYKSSKKKINKKIDEQL